MSPGPQTHLCSLGLSLPSFLLLCLLRQQVEERFRLCRAPLRHPSDHLNYFLDAAARNAGDGDHADAINLNLVAVTAMTEAYFQTVACCERSLGQPTLKLHRAHTPR